MAQDPNAKNNKSSNKQPNKQPRQINIITIVVFALVAIFFFSMLTRMPQGSSDGITQTDSLVTSEFTQAVDRGALNRSSMMREPRPSPASTILRKQQA